MSDRISQVVVESPLRTEPSSRFSQLLQEAIITSASLARNSQFLLESIISGIVPLARIRTTQYIVECVYPNLTSDSHEREKEIFYKLVMIS